MELPEFFAQLNRLSQAYDPKLFPPERVTLLFERFKGTDTKQFSEAVSHVILLLPPAANIFGHINEFLRSPPEKPIGVEFHPDNPRAKELADKYAPEIKELFKSGVGLPLPYDPKERLDNLTEADWNRIYWDHTANLHAIRTKPGSRE